MPWLVVVFSKVDVLPSVRRSVHDLCSSSLTLGSVVVCAVAMAAALLLHLCFQLPRLRFVWWARPFLEWQLPCWLRCCSSSLDISFGLDALLVCFLVYAKGNLKGKTKIAEVSQSSVGFRFIPVQVPAGVGILEAEASELLKFMVSAYLSAAAICYELVLVGAFVILVGAAASELLYSVLLCCFLRQLRSSSQGDNSWCLRVSGWVQQRLHCSLQRCVLPCRQPRSSLQGSH